ncbi:MAG: hypothetical protein QOF14_4418 [Hyphomicrobiales bacterium]|jgi:hypothetical protein|nr:hypothetical protein [Hyphomicrobiales bacterium]
MRKFSEMCGAGVVTSWPKRLPGPGMSAERAAERIAALSGGLL